MPASPAIYDPEYQRKFQYQYVHSNRILQRAIYSSKIPKRSNSFDQTDLVQMNLVSAIYLALSFINFALREHNSQPLHITQIVDEFLNSVHYETLYNNLYYNWTVENNFYYTVNFSGNPTQIADLNMGLELTKDPYFIKYLGTFVSKNKRREFLTLAINSEFQKMIYEIHLDVD